MPSKKKPESNRSCAALRSLSAALESASRALHALPENPFQALRRVDKARQLLSTSKLSPIEALESVRRQVEEECLRCEVEFWGHLADECSRRGWDLHGTTSRRIVNRAVFISLENHVVRVEGAPSASPPYAPAAIQVLSAQMETLGTSEAQLRLLLAMVSRAYDRVARSAEECNLEELYRQCVMEAQKPGFWRHPTPNSFVSLTRAMFRYALSEVLRLGITTSDGRTVGLGTTTMTKDAWELYSPGEQRVVLAGRLSLVPAGEKHEV